MKKLEKLEKLLRCYLERCTIDNAIIGLRSRVDAGAVIRDAMLIGADYYESAAKRAEVIAAGGVPIGVGADSVVSNAIVDKNARIGKNCTILNKSGVDEVRREEKGRLEGEQRKKKTKKRKKLTCFPPSSPPLRKKNETGRPRVRRLLHPVRHRRGAEERDPARRDDDLDLKNRIKREKEKERGEKSSSSFGSSIFVFFYHRLSAAEFVFYSSLLAIFLLFLVLQLSNSSLGGLLRLRSSLRLPRRPRLQRQGVQPFLKFAAERAVHEPVPRNRVFPFELLGDGLDAEVRLGVRGSGGVSGVARVEVGLVGDGEGDGGEGGLELAVL